MLTKKIDFAYPNLAAFDKFEANLVNQGSVFKGNIDFVKSYTIKNIVD